MPAPVIIPSATAVKMLQANGGNLFRIALDNLGSALQWTRIAEANTIIDPFLPPNTPVKLAVPGVNVAFGASGILRPTGGSMQILDVPTNISVPLITLDVPVNISPPVIS